MGSLAFQLSSEPSAKGLAIRGSAGCAVMSRKDGNEGGAALAVQPHRVTLSGTEGKRGGQCKGALLRGGGVPGATEHNGTEQSGF